MSGRTLTLGLAVTLVLASAAGRQAPQSVSHALTMETSAATYGVAPDRRQLAAVYGRLPLSFEENRGQAEEQVRFLARGAGHALSLGPDGATLELSRPTPNAPVSRAAQTTTSREAETVTVRMALAGSNPAPSVSGRGRLPGTTSYFEGRDPSAWLTAIPTYAKVQYDAVYPGIDLVYYGNHAELEYDFVVAPNANPRQITLTFAGVDGLTIDAAGDLRLRTGEHEIVQHRPVAYQDLGGARREVTSRYVRLGAHAVGFELGTYNEQRALVIDPVLTYSTYYGGPGGDVGSGIAVDTAGNIYVVGSTDAGSANSRIFVSKFNAAGTAELYTAMVYQQGCDSLGGGIAVDASGQAHVAGVYGDVDQFGLCNKNGAFTAKLNATGTAFLYSFATGTDAGANAVALDAQGNAYFTGRTRGDWPVTPGAFQTTPAAGADAFVLKVGPTGSLVYSTYLGGGLADEGVGIAVDAQQNAVVTGSAASDFPTTANAFSRTAGNPWVSCFVTKLNSSGSGLGYSTFLGGQQGESCTSVALDGLGKIYVTGSTTSFDFPVFPPTAYDATCGTDGLCNAVYTCSRNVCDYQYGEDVFVTKLDPALSGQASLVYSTFIGGENRDLAEAIVVDASKNVYVTGRTASQSFPMANALQGSFGGDYDVFVTEVNPTGTGVPFSTYFGGDGYDIGRGLTVDAAANVYVTGDTASTNFPTETPLRGTRSGASDAFITTIGTAGPPPPVATLASLGLNPATVAGGATSTGTVTLTSAAPAGGIVVSLTSSNPSAATVPASITVPAGAPSATFTATSRTLSATTTVAIVASDGGVTRTSSLTVTANTQTPNAPVGLAAQVSGNVVALSWAPPAGGASVSGYALDAGTSSGASNVAANYVVGQVLSVTTPVPVGTYFVRVRAFNQFGASPASGDVLFTIAGPTPPGPPRNLVASVNGATVSLSWVAPASGGPPADYVIDAGSSPGASNIASGLSVGNQLALSANVPTGAHYIRVRARNALGTSGPSNEVLAQVGGGVPDAPRNLDVTASNGFVRLRWDPPASGPRPTDYVIEAGSTRGGTDLGVFPVGNVTAIEASVGDITFFVRVRARSSAGLGAASDERLVVAASRGTP